MLTQKDIHSLEFWRIRKPELYARMADPAQRDNCPVCKGHDPHVTIIMPDGQELPLICVCHTHGIMAEAQALVKRLSDPYLPHTFDQLKPRMGDAWLPMTQAIAAARAIIASPWEAKWLTIMGSPGSGKTHIAEALCTELKHLAVFVSAESLAGLVMKALDERAVEPLKDDLVEAPILVIDDLGNEHLKNAFAVNAIAGIISRRYVARLAKPTVITTNLNRPSLNQAYPRLASRILDEMTGLATVVSVKLPDYRQKQVVS